MPTIDNPYASSFAGPLSNLAKAFMTGPDEATKIARAETALKLQRQREGTESLANAFAQFGQPGFDRNTAISAAITGGYDPNKLAVLERYGAANTYGAKDPRTTNAFVGAGGSYGSTGQGFDETQAGLDRRNDATLKEKRYEFDSKPQTVGSPTGPVLVRTADAIGKPAVEDVGKVKGDFARRAINAPGGISALNPTEQHFIGAAPGNQTPRNYIGPKGEKLQTYDGVTDARTGQPLPPGGLIAGVQGTPDQSGLRPNVQSGLQNASIENQKFKALLDHTRQLANDPSNFGIPGFVKGLAQDVTQVSDGLAKGLGYTGLSDAVADAKQKAIDNGLSPNSLPGLFTFDPRLPSLHTASDLLVYQAASALAGQSGRSVSDKDVQMFRGIVGDPRDWLGNQDKYLAKLDTIERILEVYQGVVDHNLRGGPQAPAAAQAAPGANVPPPPAPGAPQSPPVVERWQRGPDGTLQRVQ